MSVEATFLRPLTQQTHQLPSHRVQDRTTAVPDEGADGHAAMMPRRTIRAHLAGVSADRGYEHDAISTASGPLRVWWAAFRRVAFAA
jgi:hypothetical protein